jgi:menaquinone-dependent protoporphyrinogen IX oxidase
MKVLVVFDSKYGNNRELAKFIAENLQKGGHEVKVSYAKELKPEIAFGFQPEILLFGGPVRMGKPSHTAKGWISKFSSLLMKNGFKISKTAVWGTHGDAAKMAEKFGWAKVAPQWEKLCADIPAVKTLPGVLDFMVEKEEVSLESGWQAKVNEFVERVINL